MKAVEDRVQDKVGQGNEEWEATRTRDKNGEYLQARKCKDESCKGIQSCTEEGRYRKSRILRAKCMKSQQTGRKKKSKGKEKEKEMEKM